MRVTVKLFAVLRERAGRAEVGLDVPAGTTAAQAAGKLVEEIPAVAGLIGRAVVDHLVIASGAHPVSVLP